MKIHQQTDAGTLPNEDRVWTGEGAAIVLDGTSGLTDRQFFDAASDGCWYVNTFLDALTARIHTSTALTEVVATAIEPRLAAPTEENSIDSMTTVAL